MEYQVNYCLNLDKRDSEGWPLVIKTPKDPIKIKHEDVVHLSFSIIENGVEKVLLTNKLWKENVMLNHES